MQLEQDDLVRKNAEIATAFKEKAKQHQHHLKQYQKLKQQQLSADMEFAAKNDAEQYVHAGHNSHSSHPMQGRESRGSGGSGGKMRTFQFWENPAMGNGAGGASFRECRLKMHLSGY